MLLGDVAREAVALLAPQLHRLRPRARRPATALYGVSLDADRWPAQKRLAVRRLARRLNRAGACRVLAPPRLFAYGVLDAVARGRGIGVRAAVVYSVAAPAYLRLDVLVALESA